MENIVPSVLQRLRAADVIRMAGLKAASQGQEYCRSGAVHSTQRQGMHIAGVVHVSPRAPVFTTFSAPAANVLPQPEPQREQYPVEVEIQSPTAWTSSCPCTPGTTTICPHAAALLYQWLARPLTFTTSVPLLSSASFPAKEEPEREVHRQAFHEIHAEPEAARTTGTAKSATPAVLHRGPTPLHSLVDILAQVGLGELRNIAREYELAINGMGKQQLTEAIIEALQQSDTVRHVAATLEKPQRQLLAALTLAGGSMTDEDLRGLYERFKLGQPNQLQGILLALQGKALLFRTSLTGSSQQRMGLNGVLLDIGWYVPTEVRAALSVSVPITLFDVESDEHAVYRIERTEPYTLLADLLLVARALDGQRLSEEEQSASSRPDGAFVSQRPSGSLTGDGSISLPPPANMPSSALLASLEALIVRSPALLGFAVRLLRLSDILHKDDGGTPYQRILPGAAQLLLGPARAEVIHDLFELWLTQSSYDELFELQEDGLRLRCRASALNHPILRPGELETENSEARQSLVSLFAQAPLNQWISFSAFARFVYRINPLFLQKRQRLFTSPHWWIEQEEGRPLHPLQLGDWSHAEYHYLTRLLRGPLHWWGTCDLALTQDGRILAFRLTPLAGWLFNGISPDTDDKEEKMAIDAAGALEFVDKDEVLVPSSPQAWPLVELMDTFTERAGVRSGRLCYHLTPEALGHALSQGLRPTALLNLLHSAVVDGTQDNEALPRLLEQFERWISSYGRVRIYTGVNMLETADTLVMRELSATTSLDAQIIQTLQPTQHILKKPGAERVIDDLKRRGQTPLLHHEETYGKE